MKITSSNGRSGLNKSNRLDKQSISWALYDWANSAFATTVMAGFYPLFFKQFWSQGASTVQSTYYLGLGNSLASLVLAFSAPYLGAIADISKNKKKFLLFFACLGVIGTAGLFFVQLGQWPLAVGFYVLASLGFAGGNIFYDALLPIIAKAKDFDFLSGLGYSAGYLGGGLLFAINVVMTLKPEWFGIPDASWGVRISFLTVALWWVVFTIPLIKYVNENHNNGNDLGEIAGRSRKRLIHSVKEIMSQPIIFLFLLGYLFYIDGVNTIVKMAVDYGLSLGFESSHLITALLITQFVGFPSAVAFGYLGEKWNAVGGIFVALIVYVGISIWGYFLQEVHQFYYMAIGIGLVQGGIQALSRSHYAKLIPKNQEAEYFGFFNMLGKFSAVLGPFLMGWVSLSTGNPRYSIFVVIIFFVIGGCFLMAHLQKQNKRLSPNSQI